MKVVSKQERAGGERNMKKCDGCGGLFPEDELYKKIGGDLLCEECNELEREAFRDKLLGE